MNDRVEELIERIERPGDDESPDAIVRHCEWLADASYNEIEQLLDYLLTQAVDSNATAGERNLERMLVHLVAVAVLVDEVEDGQVVAGVALDALEVLEVEPGQVALVVLPGLLE